MRTVILIGCIAILASTVASQEPAEPMLLTTPQEAKTALKELILTHYPDAKLILNERFFAAQANTMEFTIHRTMRDGTITEIPEQRIGPKHNGFMLSVALNQGQYGGPLILPQTLSRPYWNTHVAQIVNRDNDSHLFVKYSFGSRVETKFHSSVLMLLHGTPCHAREESQPKNNGNKETGEHSSLPRKNAG